MLSKDLTAGPRMEKVRVREEDVVHSVDVAGVVSAVEDVAVEATPADLVRVVSLRPRRRQQLRHRQVLEGVHLSARISWQ